MPSPETSSTQPAERKPSRSLPWIVLVCFILLGIILYAASRPPAGPPVIGSPPVGKLYFLMVNQSSEHTAALRGLYALPAGQTKPTLLMEEAESQGMEDSPRQWISFPRVSPDGRYLAYLSTSYLITDESQTHDEQLMAIPLVEGAKPKVLVDLSAKKLTARTGISWTPDSRHIAFLDNGNLVQVDPESGRITTTPGVAPANAGEPSFAADGAFDYLFGDQLCLTTVANPFAERHLVNISAYALSPTGTLATISQAQPHEVSVAGKTYTLQWARPWYYQGQVTSLGWSPDGAYLGYTVTNPIVPEEGFYLLRLSDGKCFRLPFSTSRAGWTWTK